MTHGVLIQIGEHDPGYWAFRALSKPVRLKGPNGEVSEQTSLLFFGVQIECEGPYLRVHLDRPHTGLAVMIPHHLVVLAVSDDQSRTIGFGFEA